MLYLTLGGQAVLVAFAYWWERRARLNDSPSKLRRALMWSGIWLALGLLPTLLFGLLKGAGPSSAYAAVYLIERALSLDNVFVFAVLIGAFEIPNVDQDRVVSHGALFAFALRVPAIFAGVALFDASHLVSYGLGALLIVLAWHTARADHRQTPAPSRIITALQRRLPISDHAGYRWIVMRDGQRQMTPVLLCLTAIALADIAFALDSIPAALAVSHDAPLLLSANLLALLGLRPLYQLVAVAREQLRYMDQTIAVLLMLVGVKLLSDDLLHVGPLASLLVILIVLGSGGAISLRVGAEPDSSAS
jgi:tellurite resistance protein TerC